MAPSRAREGWRRVTRPGAAAASVPGRAVGCVPRPRAARRCTGRKPGKVAHAFPAVPQNDIPGTREPPEPHGRLGSVVMRPGPTSLRMRLLVCCEEETADEREATRRFGSGDVGLVLGVSATGWFGVRTSSVNEYFIPVRARRSWLWKMHSGAGDSGPRTEHPGSGWGPRLRPDPVAGTMLTTGRKRSAAREAPLHQRGPL